jgi:uncharacterized protein
LTTDSHLLERPYPVSFVLELVESWLALPQVFVPVPSDRHFSILKKMLLNVGRGGNLTTDAHLAALAIEKGLVLHTADVDFARFHGLKWVNPPRFFAPRQ